jgi:KaiC domain protein
VADDEDDGEDWFESAFDDDADDADSGATGDADGDQHQPDGEPAERAAIDDDPVESDATGDESVESDASEADSTEPGASETEDPPGDTPDAGDPTDSDTADDPTAPDNDADDLAAAFGVGSSPPDDVPESAESQDGDTADDFAAAFEGGDGDGGDGDDGGELFDDDFADAFAGADAGGAGGTQMPGGGGDQNFGFDVEGDAGGGGGPGGDFEEEDFESDIPRIDVGIEGLDEMIQGGVPERSLMVTVGEAGTGKTTFGLQFLNEAIQNGERAVFITLEESRERVVQSADEKGWNFSEHTDAGDLAVIDIDPIEMANSLTSIRNELPRLVEEFGASRLVLDSVSLLEMMYDDQSTRRTEIYDFTKALKEAGVTTMLTSEASEDNPFASRYGVIEYLTDAVVVLRYIRPEDFRETRLAVEIQKIRDANHSRETKPYEITHQGISVYRQANIF